MAKQKKPVNFTSRPGAEDMKSKMNVLRVGPKGVGPVVVISHDTLGAYTHYAHGRTRPCPGATCGICADGEQPRWRGYLVIASQDLQELRVLEVTPAVMPKIDQHFREHRTLRGAKIVLRRKNERANGELWIGIQAKPANSAALPKAPSLEKFLNAMWGLTKKAGTDQAQPAPKIYPAEQGPDFGEEVA